MDDILIDENYDEIKDAVWKGLTARQLGFSLLAMLCGAAVFLLCIRFHIPEMIALYLSIFAALPSAVNGFLEIYGMTIWQFWNCYRKIKKHPGFFYISEESPEFFYEEESKKEKKKESKKEKKPVLLYTDLDGMIQDAGRRTV